MPRRRELPTTIEDKPTLESIDEALAFATEIPMSERGNAWYAYVDSLLAQRLVSGEG